MKTVTKRDLVVQISNETGMTQQQVFDVIQKTLDTITTTLAGGDEVVLRNFGSFQIREYKSKVGRNPNKPESDIIIPDRARVKFKAGKALKERVVLLGLTELSDAAAEALSKHQGDLALWSLTELSDAAAEALSKHEGHLTLGLEELSDATAESLSKHKGSLRLGSLTKLSDAAAESLSKHKGDLSLSGLTELSDAAAESLSKSKDDLDLSGLTELTNTSLARKLARQGNLFLWSLNELSDAAAEALSKHQGQINWEDPGEWIRSLGKSPDLLYDSDETEDYCNDDDLHQNHPSWDEVTEDRIVNPNESGWITCPDCGCKFKEHTRDWEDDVATHCNGHYFKRPR